MGNYMAFAIAVGLTGSLFADGNSASSSASAGVRIVAPVKITAIQHLNFGSIVVEDVKKSSTITMAFNGFAPGVAGNLSGDLSPTKLSALGNCTLYRKSAAHTPALFHFQKDEWVASTSNLGGTGIFDTDVTVVIDGSVILSGGTGGPVSLTVATDLPSDPFTPAGASPGLVYRRFQVGGTLYIPPESLGLKTGSINVSISYN
jgi:hypothetical protein